MIDWISVKARVPDDRRDVLVCGHTRMFTRTQYAITKCNISSDGGHRFDVERGMFGLIVTNWAELDGPQLKRAPPPPSPPKPGRAGVRK